MVWEQVGEWSGNRWENGWGMVWEQVGEWSGNRWRNGLGTGGNGWGNGLERASDSPIKFVPELVSQQQDSAVQQVLALHTLLESCEFKKFWTALRESSEVVELVRGMEEAARSCESSGLQ